MDVFVEQLIKRNNKTSEKVLRFALYAVCGLVAGFTILFFMNLAGGRLFPFAFLIAVGLCYLAYFVSGQLNIEFEYILTNGTFDVDAVINMRKRKRLLSFECKDVESFGKYNAEQNYNCNGTVFAANADSDNLFYAICSAKEKGKVLFVFDPNEKMVAGLKKCLPRQMSLSAFGN